MNADSERDKGTKGGRTANGRT